MSLDSGGPGVGPPTVVEEVEVEEEGGETGGQVVEGGGERTGEGEGGVAQEQEQSPGEPQVSSWFGGEARSVGVSIVSDSG